MKHKQRKQMIMETALALFARNGYHDTSVADIVREMGVARGTFYRYFNDKHDLFSQLLDENFRYIKRVLPELPRDRRISAGEIEVLLAQAFRELLSHPNSRDFVSMMINGAGADKVFVGKVQEFYDGMAEVFSGYISSLQKEGLIMAHNPSISSRLVLGALKEIFIQWSQGDNYGDLEELVHEVVTFLVHGMGPRAAE